MLSSKTSDKYLYWFYLLGLSVYNPRDTKPSKGCTLIRKSIPSICFLLITILSASLSFDLYVKRSITLNDCLHSVYLMFTLTTGFMVFKRSSFLRGDTKYIWAYLIDLDQLTFNRLKLDVNFKKFTHIYKRKLLCMIFFFGCYLAFKIFYRMLVGKAIRQLGALILLLITLGVNFHILFYVELFNFIFQTINQYTLKKNLSTQTDAVIVDVNFNEKTVHLFQTLKLIHFKLWTCVRLINSDFGATLVLLIIQNSHTAIETFYWIIIEFYEEDILSDMRIISEYVLLVEFIFY